MVDAASSGHKISLSFLVCSECIPTGTTSSRKEADYWLENLRASQGIPGCCWASERKLSTILTAPITKQIANCFILWYLSSAPVSSSDFRTLHQVCSHSAPESQYYPLSSDLETSKLHFPGQVLAKTVHVLSQTVRTCIKIPCTHEAPFSCLLSRNGSCLPRQDILGLEVDGMDQAAAYCTGRCANETANACVREHSTLPRRMCLPGLIVATFRRLSSRRRLQSSRPSETFACPAWDEYLPGFANSKSSSTQGSPRCHSAP